MFSLQRQIFNLILDLPDLLLSILKDEKLFQFGAHVALKLVTRRSGVNRTQRLLRSRADGNVLRLGSDNKPGEPFGDWIDMRGTRWRRKAAGSWERVE